MPNGTFQHILVENAGNVATITLNRPKVLNALNAALLGELSLALLELEQHPEIQAIVLTGAGERAFAAGADIGELNALDGASEGTERARTGQALTLQMEHMHTPVIAAVNGFALGGGCELAMAADIRIASENAKFGQPEVNLGLLPGYGGSQRATRLLGKGMALYLCLTGETIDAQEALRIGLVQRVVPLVQLLPEAKRIAQLVASKGPLAVAACKRAIHAGAHLSLADALELEAKEFGTLVASEDFKEGSGAFLEKRAARWKGR